MISLTHHCTIHVRNVLLVNICIINLQYPLLSLSASVCLFVVHAGRESDTAHPGLISISRPWIVVDYNCVVAITDDIRRLLGMIL